MVSAKIGAVTSKDFPKCSFPVIPHIIFKPRGALPSIPTLLAIQITTPKLRSKNTDHDGRTAGLPYID